MTDRTLPCLVKLPQAAAALGVSHRKVRRLIAAGELTAIRLGERGHVLIDVAELEALVERSRCGEAERCAA